MNKFLLLTIIFGSALIIFLSQSISIPKESAGLASHKNICDSTITDCISENLQAAPKGVCIPGGKCT